MTLETATEQASPTAMAMVVSTDVPGNCIAPSEAAGWGTYRKYTIQVNDTLSSLARRTNTTLEKIQQANCRNINDTIIYAGQTLYLPLLPPPITAIAAITTPTAPPTGFSPRIVVSPTTGTSETIFTFLVRDYQPYMEVLVRIESAAGSEIVRFQVKMDANGDRDVQWQSPKKLSPGFYAVKPYNPAGTLGGAGTIVIVPPTYP
jgi:LysM repeat protein